MGGIKARYEVLGDGTAVHSTTDFYIASHDMDDAISEACEAMREWDEAANVEASYYDFEVTSDEDSSYERVVEIEGREASFNPVTDEDEVSRVRIVLVEEKD